ncbi:MAG: DNA methylase [Bacteroidetes bacterium]|nr:DNA methylase [Bacteroidota bacterium]
MGNPVAFIEIAWRRYTKHSRNKAQEIQGAIIPLKEMHHRFCPFIGVVLAGEFTEGSLAQLRSHKFAVLYFPFHTIVEAFNTAGIDANSNEETPDTDFARKVKAWESLSKVKQERVRKAMRDLNATEVARFTQELELAITRLLVSVRVLPLHGTVFAWDIISDAVRFIQNYDEGANSHNVIRYEIELLYSNGDKISGSFLNRLDAIQFLRDYECEVLTPA